MHMAEKQLIMIFLHLLFPMFLTECFSLPKVFLAATASLGEDRFVVAFCVTRKKSQKTYIKKQGGDVFSHPGITLCCWDLKQGSRGFHAWWKLSSKAQQDLRSHCWGHPVSQGHSHKNTLLLLGWLQLILGFKTRYLQLPGSAVTPVLEACNLSSCKHCSWYKAQYPICLATHVSMNTLHREARCCPNAL